MSEYKAHLFICTNKPNIEGKCGFKGAESLRMRLKQRCKNESWACDVRVNSAGCLDKCEHGIAAVMYPNTRWFLNLESTDDEKLFEALKQEVTK